MFFKERIRLKFEDAVADDFCSSKRGGFGENSDSADS